MTSHKASEYKILTKMRSKVGILDQSKVAIIAGDAHTMDDARDDTMVSGRPVTIDAESKPLFRTASPKIEYAASSPYYDVLLYSFTPEQEQKLKLSNNMITRIPSSRVTKPTVVPSNMNKGLDDKSTTMNTTSGSNVTTKHIRDQLRQSGTSVQTNDEDKIGDGDQSPIYDPYVHKVYLELFRTGTF
jgi:hypothetical protein